ncbi:MAG: hypothetical protein EAZ08_00395 [Cytophagales bacterium]|nr:MAG: hypothetical protein EAZ08_00395 [Cytophagales bacterium]
MYHIKKTILITLACVTLAACGTKETQNKQKTTPIAGTWKLISGTLIEKGDTVVTDYTQNQTMIKVINETHFAFLKHDLLKGKDSTAVYGSGGGRYTLVGDQYTEHLEYCSDRQWEDNSFSFTVAVKNDTLVQQGVEKIENLGVNRINIEKYVRIK